MTIPKLSGKITLNNFDQLKCAGPAALRDWTLVSLQKHNLRCLDSNGAQPQNDAVLLVGIFIGILLAVPATLSAFVIWRKGFFGCGPKGPASYSRAFYKRTNLNEQEGYM